MPVAMEYLANADTMSSGDAEDCDEAIYEEDCREQEQSTNPDLTAYSDEEDERDDSYLDMKESFVDTRSVYSLPRMAEDESTLMPTAYFDMYDLPRPPSKCAGEKRFPKFDASKWKLPRRPSLTPGVNSSRSSR